jgi:hypothetical protein
MVKKDLMSCQKRLYSVERDLQVPADLMPPSRKQPRNEQRHGQVTPEQHFFLTCKQ